MARQRPAVDLVDDPRLGEPLDELADRVLIRQEDDRRVELAPLHRRVDRLGHELPAAGHPEVQLAAEVVVTRRDHDHPTAGRHVRLDECGQVDAVLPRLVLDHRQRPFGVVPAVDGEQRQRRDLRARPRPAEPPPDPPAEARRHPQSDRDQQPHEREGRRQPMVRAGRHREHQSDQQARQHDPGRVGELATTPTQHLVRAAEQPEPTERERGRSEERPVAEGVVGDAAGLVLVDRAQRLAQVLIQVVAERRAGQRGAVRPGPPAAEERDLPGA